LKHGYQNLGYWADTKDQNDGDSIVEHLGEFASQLVRKNTAGDAIRPFSSSRKKVVSNDSGLMHNRGGRFGTEVTWYLWFHQASYLHPPTELDNKFHP